MCFLSLPSSVILLLVRHISVPHTPFRLIASVSLGGVQLYCFLIFRQVPSGDCIGPLAKRFWETLTDIQYGRVEHPWSVKIS